MGKQGRRQRQKARRTAGMDNPYASGGDNPYSTAPKKSPSIPTDPSVSSPDMVTPGMKDDMGDGTPPPQNMAAMSVLIHCFGCAAEGLVSMSKIGRIGEDGMVLSCTKCGSTDLDAVDAPTITPLAVRQASLAKTAQVWNLPPMPVWPPEDADGIMSQVNAIPLPIQRLPPVQREQAARVFESVRKTNPEVEPALAWRLAHKTVKTATGEATKRYIQPSKSSKTHKLVRIEDIPEGTRHPYWQGKTQWALSSCGTVFDVDLVTDEMSAKGMCGICAKSSTGIGDRP